MKQISIILIGLITLFACKKDEKPYPGSLSIDAVKLELTSPASSATKEITTDVGPVVAKVNEDVDWCSVTGSDKNGVTISAKENTSDEPRETTISVQAGYKKASFVVLQQGTIWKALINNGWTATCSSQQISDGGGINSIFEDDKQTTFWHSNYTPSAEKPPHWIIVDLQEAKQLNKVRVGWRQYGDKFYATCKTAEIHLSTDGTNFTKVGQLDKILPEGAPMSSVDYPAFDDVDFANTSARYVKILITAVNSANGTTQVSYFKAYAK